MQPQIAHETEVHRQHVRLKIPIGVEIDGKRFAVEDWSMGGFGVESSIAGQRPGERFPVRLIFPFEDFEVSMKLEGQMVYILEDDTRFGCKFTSLSQGQSGLFRALVDSYLSGEIVGGGDLLALAGRDGTAVARLDPKGLPTEGRGRGGRWLRQGLGYLLLLLLALGLGTLVWLGVYERYFAVEAREAVIEAPTVRLRAPASGILRALEAPGILEAGTPLAMVEPAAGGTPIPITSPCACIRDDWLVLPGQFVPEGEVVARLVDAKAPLMVRARVAFEQAIRLAPGATATIRIPGVADPLSGQVERIDARATGGDGLVSVVVRPDKPLPFEDLGSLVAVRFD